jgi:hypothetical protein
MISNVICEPQDCRRLFPTYSLVQEAGCHLKENGGGRARKKRDGQLF